MYIYEIILTMLMIGGGITIGSLVTLFITYKVMFSDRVLDKITEKSVRMSKKITETVMEDFIK